LEQPEKILKINTISRSVQLNETKIATRHSRKFVYFYTYLALLKKEGIEEGATTSEIHSLKYWQNQQFESVGKQIAEHISKQEEMGIKIIDVGRGKTKGPYSLNIPPENISFDKEIEEIAKEFSKLKFFIPIAMEKKERDGFYEYAMCLVRGFWKFNHGKLKEALGEIDKSLNIPTFKENWPAHKINLLSLKAQILERKGEFSESIKVLKEAQKLIDEKEVIFFQRIKGTGKNEGKINERAQLSPDEINFLKSEISLRFGLGYFRDKRHHKINLFTHAPKYYEEAKKYLEKAKNFKLIGDYHRGWGLLILHTSTEENVDKIFRFFGQRSFLYDFAKKFLEKILPIKKEDEALHHFDTALNYYLLSKDIYGIQAVCFNIANAIYKKGVRKFPSIKSVKDSVENRWILENYLNRAEKWAERALEITEETKLGKETLQTEILLSIIHLERSEKIKVIDEDREKELDLALKHKIKNKDKVIDMFEMEKYAEDHEIKFDLATIRKVIGIVYAKKVKILSQQRNPQTKDYLLKTRDYLEKAKTSFESLKLSKPIREIMEYEEYIKKLQN